ncbi:hypothetical protein Tco_0282728 [Tanacetum coccineum]
MLKTRDYDLLSMRMEKYLTHTDYALWEVIVIGDAPAIASASVEGPIPPKTVEQKLVRKNELKAKSIMLLVIPNVHMLKFHRIMDAKSLFKAIKNRFGGNKESKKMQKSILKQNYENFVASGQEGLDKVYDSFQVEEDYTNFALMVYTSQGSSSSSSSESEVYKKRVREYHAVFPYTGNFKPTRADLSVAGLDDSVYKSNVSETITSKDSLDTTTSETSKDS